MKKRTKYNYNNFDEMRELINSKTNGLSELWDMNGAKRARDKIKMKCSCGDFFYPTFDSIIRNTSYSCRKCGVKRGSEKQKMTQSEFEEICKAKLGDEYVVLDKYESYTKEVNVFHKKCGKIYRAMPCKIKMGHGCHYCNMNVKKTTAEIKNKIKELTNGECEVLSEYTGIDDKLEVKHLPCGNTFMRSAYQFINVNSVTCPHCKKLSKGCEIIRSYLDRYDIEYELEKSFDDCKRIRLLAFDFYLPRFNMCIEYDGEHHRRAMKHRGGEDNLRLVKERDTIKNEYCKNNNIHLVRIDDGWHATKDYIENILKKEIESINMITPR